MWYPVIWWWCIFVSYFSCNNVLLVFAMPHHEPGHFNIEEEIASYGHDDRNMAGDPSMMEGISNSFDIMEESVNLPSSVFANNGTTINTNLTMEDSAIIPTEPTASISEIPSESEPTPSFILASNNVNDGDGSEETSIIPVNATEAAKTAAAIEFIPNEKSSPLAETGKEKVTEQQQQQQQEVENVVEDAGIGEFPLNFNSRSPTIATVLSLPLLPPPPPPPPVVDPISFDKSNHGGDDGDDVSFTKITGDNGVSSTSTTYLAAAPPSLPTASASSPSIQLIPPAHQLTLSLPDIPREPDQGELPESPEPHPPQHPYNLRDIPISLLSLSGNSGGSTSDMATFSSFVSPTENVPIDFSKFRYHVVTGQLVKIGSSGPGICPQNMRFFAVPGHPKNGACDCDYYQCSRPLIYSSERHQCYWAWSQGPCDQGEWFVFEKDLRRRAKCEKNPCSSESSSTLNNTTATTSYNLPQSTSLSDYNFQSQEDQACYQAGTQGYCGDADERLLTFPGEPIPKCRKFTLCYPLTVPQELQCIYGNKYFVESGQCQ